MRHEKTMHPIKKIANLKNFLHKKKIMIQPEDDQTDDPDDVKGSLQ